VIYINFQNNEDYKRIFDNNLEIENIKLQISSYFTDAKFEEDKTVIILDEIQECSRARLALKFFKLDGKYDVIATGSLLGVRGLNNDITSVPVGYEEELKMYPLDFEEFLWAKGIKEEIIDEIKRCFIEKKKEKDNLQYIHSKNKYYYFDKMGIVFVNVRVGLDKIPKEYYKGIKGLFELKECIGIVGGKTRLAYYFIGYDNDSDSLLYLDPHVTKEADKEVNLNNVLGKHINKEVHLLKMTKMSTAFTIGFCFRNYDEFLHLFEFWQKAKQDKLPILGIVKQPIVIDFKDNDEDFSPTYDDKEEDDF
jgi:hypothetical protein